MPSPYAEMFGQGKNVAGATDTQETLGKPRGRLAKAADFLTSGTEFIGATSEALTGHRLDVTRLPGYLEQPIDILANPLSLGLIAATPFTGGSSLAALGARGVGSRLAGAAITDLAGGLVGGSAAQVSRELLPDGSPDWLKLAVPLVAGITAGGGASVATARRLPDALQSASRTGKATEDLATDLYATGHNVSKGVPSQSPMDLPTVSPGLTKMEQVLNVAKGIFPKLGLPVDERFNPIIKQAKKNTLTVESMKQVIFQEIKADVKALDIRHIKNADGSGYSAWKIGDNWVPVQDAAAHPSLFALSQPQIDFIKRWNTELNNHRDLLATTMGEMKDVADPVTGQMVKQWKPATLDNAKFVDPDGWFLTRGRPMDDSTVGIVPPAGRPKNMRATPGTEKNQVYSTIAEGVADGQYYPPIEEAFADYIGGVGNALTGRHALNQMMQLTDADGVPLIINLNRAYPLRDEAGEVILDAMGKPQTAMYTAPTGKTQFTLAGQPGLAAEGRLAAYLNNQLDPRGELAAASKLAEAFNKPLRTLHVAVDMGDFIARLGPTNALLHPIVFAKATGKGFAAVFNREIVGQEYKAINLENMTNGLNGMTVRDMAGKAGVRFQQTDFATGGLKNVPGISHLGSVYGNALDLMRARMMQAEMLNKLNNGVDVFDPTIMRQIASGVNLTTGATNNPTPAGAGIFVQFPNWLQSQVELIGKAASLGTIDGAYARRSLMGVLALGTGAATIGNAVQGHAGKTVSAENDYVPTLYIGDQKINIFGPYASLYKGLKSALEGDPSRLIRGRASPLLSVFWDTSTGTTLMGQKASFDSPEYWAKMLLPYSISSVEQGIENKQIAGGILQAVGVNAREATPKQKLEQEAEAVFGKSWEDFTGKEKQQLKLSNPELFAELDRQTRQRAEAGDKISQGVVASQAATEALMTKQTSLKSLLDSGELSPKQFREALNAAVQETAIQKQQIRKDFGLEDKPTKNPTPVQEALDKYYNLYDTADVGFLQGTAPVGQVNWDEFDRQAATLLATFTPEQRKAIEDRVVLRSPEVDWYYSNRDLINESNYFQTTDKAFEQLKASVQRRMPGVDTLAELYREQNKALQNQDRATYVYVGTLINTINNIAEKQKKLMRLKDPALLQALVQNGYVTQSKTAAFVQQP